MCRLKQKALSFISNTVAALLGMDFGDSKRPTVQGADPASPTAPRL
jgi:hypothetical protein